MEHYVTKAHKIAYAIHKKTGQNIAVFRMPLGKLCIAFEFSNGKRSVAFGQSFLDGDLAQFATRVMNGLTEVVSGNTKGNVSHKSKGV